MFLCVCTRFTLTQALVGVVSRSSSPGTGVIEGLAHAAVVTFRVVFAVTHQLTVLVLHALAGMAITLAPMKARAI